MAYKPGDHKVLVDLDTVRSVVSDLCTRSAVVSGDGKLLMPHDTFIEAIAEECRKYPFTAATPEEALRKLEFTEDAFINRWNGSGPNGEGLEVYLSDDKARVVVTAKPGDLTAILTALVWPMGGTQQ